MATRKVELLISPAGHDCRLLLDGEEVQNCRAVSIRSEVGEASVVTFELINVELVVKGKVDADKVTTIDVAPKIVDMTAMDEEHRHYEVVRD